MEKPDVDSIEGLSPAISIEQKSAGHNPRSTVGTVTEIYDYLRLLYARAGTPHCPNCGRAVQRQSAAQIADVVLAWPRGHAHRGARAAGAGPQGRVPRTLRVGAQAGVRPRLRGRRVDRGRGAAEAQPAPEPRHLRGRRPARGAGRRSRPPHRFDRNRAQAGRRPGGGRTTPTARRTEIFSERYGCPTCGISLPDLEPRQFSFNSPFGACPACGGLGTRRRVSEALVLGDPQHLDPRGRRAPVGRADRLPAQGGAAGARPPVQVRPQHAVGRSARRRCATVILHGDGRAPAADREGRSGRGKACIANVERRYEDTGSDAVRLELQEYMLEVPCDDLPRPPAQARIAGRHRRRPEHRRDRRPADRRRAARLLRRLPVAHATGDPGSTPTSPARS